MIFRQNLECRNESRLFSYRPLSWFALPHSRLPLAVYRARWLLLQLCYGRLQRFNYSQLWSLLFRQRVPVTFLLCIKQRTGVSQVPSIEKLLHLPNEIRYCELFLVVLYKNLCVFFKERFSFECIRRTSLCMLWISIIPMFLQNLFSRPKVDTARLVVQRVCSM